MIERKVGTRLHAGPPGGGQAGCTDTVGLHLEGQVAQVTW